MALAELEDEPERVVADEVVAEDAGCARGRRRRGLLAHDRQERLVQLPPVVRHVVRAARGKTNCTVRFVS